MWKEVAFVFLLLHGASGETVPDKTRSEERLTTGQAASPPFRGNLLVVPMDGSHWVTIKAIAQEIGRRGHRVTVVIPEISVKMGPGKHYDTVVYPVPYDKAYFDSVLDMHKGLLDKSKQSLIERMTVKTTHMRAVFNLFHTTAESLLFNASLISHLEQQGFDAVLTDPMIPTGALIAHKFGLPIINVLRGIPCRLDMKSAGCPSLPSFVPRLLTRNTDKMNFKERVINTVVALLEPLMCRLLFWRFDGIAYRFLGEEVGVAEVLSNSDIWLMRIDVTMDFPQPLMPNMVLVGGINCDVRAPLPEDLEPWVSGEHGFVVFTFGTMVSDMPEEMSSIFLEAFAQIPQKVIWRYTGQVPDNIPANVKIMKWVPQNDLLAHPGARAFITHAGSHGIFEGLCHAVPMLMLPLIAEQPDNAARMESKGVGVVLDVTTMTAESLLRGLHEVINDVRYKENMKRLSALHRDRPLQPLDLSVYWTEYVMRHKGAKHLKPAVHNLNWIQYFCLDVIALLATVVIVFIVLTVKCIKLCLGKVTRKRKQD